MSKQEQNISIKGEVLQFNEQFQRAVIGHMLTNYSFFLRCHLMIEPTHFQDPADQVIVDAAYKMYKQMGESKQVTHAEAFAKICEKFIDLPTQSKYKSRIDDCILCSRNLNVKYISSSMTSWVKLLKLKNSMIRAEQFYNKREYNEAVDWLRKTMVEIAQSDFEQDDRVRFNVLVDMDIRKVQFDNCCTLGDPSFDNLLIDGADLRKKEGQKCDPDKLETLTSGGLAPGDTTVLMGTSNAGKTSTVITIIGHNIKMGKKVLYITHEQKPEDIKTRLYQSLSGYNGTALSRLRQNETYKNNALAAEELLNRNLHYIPFNKPGQMFVENVMSLITIQQEKLIAETGKGFDLVVCDYPGKLKSNTFGGRDKSGWEEKVYVYDQFVNAAEHYRFHALLPVQANRDAFKVNRGDSKRLLDMGDVADAYGIMQIASNVITINRSPDDAGKNRLIFYVAKCRSHEPYWVFMTETHFDTCRTHGWRLNNYTLDPANANDPKALADQLTSLTGSKISTKPIIQDGLEQSNDFNVGLAAHLAPTEDFGSPGDGNIPNFEMDPATTKKLDLSDHAVNKDPVAKS